MASFFVGSDLGCVFCTEKKFFDTIFFSTNALKVFSEEKSMVYPALSDVAIYSRQRDNRNWAI